MKTLLQGTLLLCAAASTSLTASELGSLSQELRIKQLSQMNVTFGGTQTYKYVTDAILLEKIFLKKHLTSADLGNVSSSGSAHVWVQLNLPISYYERFVVNKPVGTAVGNVSAGRDASAVVHLRAPILSPGEVNIGNVVGGARSKSATSSVQLDAPLLYRPPSARTQIGTVTGGRQMQTATTNFKTAGR